MDDPVIAVTPSPRRIEEASRAIRRNWDYDQRHGRRRAAERRQLKLLRALRVPPGPATVVRLPRTVRRGMAAVAGLTAG